MKLSQGRQAILELLEEKERPLGIDDILKGLSRPRSRYQAVRKTLQRMVQDGQLVRLDRGRYAARGASCKGRWHSRESFTGDSEDTWGLCPCPRDGR